MGNSHPGNTCTDVGMNASVLFTREERYLEEGKSEKWLVSYSVGWSMVVLVLERIYGKDGETKLLQFQVTEPGFIKFIIDRAENDLFNQIEIFGYGASYETNFVNETKNRWGGDTKTKVLHHGSENKGNLLVVEEKRKSGVEKPCAVTVAHYYAVSSRNFISRKKYDVGLSIVLDIRVLNNDLDVSVRGPSQHPSSALLQMFQQVSRTWTWKWTACSHCAAEIQKRQRSGVNGQQIETETETENDDEEINYLQWPKKIGGNILANQGVVKGNNNGNLIVKQLILRRG